jgi:hypothetical protein
MMFSDGVVIPGLTPDTEVALREVEVTARKVRRACYAREGEIRIGLPRRIFLPLLWEQTQVDGVAEPATELVFAGVVFFLN